MRFQTAKACRRLEIHRASDLHRLNPAQLCERCTRISFASEAYVQKTIRDEVKKDIRRYRRKPTHPLDDKDRARIRYFIPNVLRRSGHDRAQWLKDHYPKRVRTTVSSSMLAIPTRLTWPTATNTPMARHNIHTPPSRKPSTVNDPTFHSSPSTYPDHNPDHNPAQPKPTTRIHDPDQHRA
jgi:hypothetical protein